MINIFKHIENCKSVILKTGNVPEGLLGFCHDTRSYLHPSFFVAYKGAKYNPIEHIGDILKKGCPVVIYGTDEADKILVEKYKSQFPNVCFVQVEDTIKFTQEISSLHSKEWQGRGGYLFAISGSNGKTTHKEMLSFILNSVFPGLIESTQKNNNNHLGVPFTLLQIKPDTKVCVLELGSNHPGEIKLLCDIAQPRGGLVTNIGATHLEFFDNLENVFIEEGYLYKHLLEKMPEGVLFFQNIDDEFLKKFPQFKGVITFSKVSKAADYYFEINAPGVKIISPNHEEEISNLHIAGTHNFSNLATAYLIAQNLYPNKNKELVEACKEFKPTFNRSQWQKILDKETFLDAYNANPSSMKIALDGFYDELKRLNVDEAQVVLILGDMNELGNDSDKYHQDLGEFLKKWPRSKVVFVGRFASHYLKGLGWGSSFANVSEIKGPEWREITRNATHVFIKGSRSLQLESLLAIT